MLAFYSWPTPTPKFICTSCLRCRGDTRPSRQRTPNGFYRYITGIVSQHNQKLLAINGMPDHLHLLIGLLIGLRPDMALAELMRDVKASSSKFINEQRWVAGKFAWQAGYGAFSYSASQLPDVIRYIEGQQAHHCKQTFQEEYQSMLNKFGIDYDPRYVFTAE